MKSQGEERKKARARRFCQENNIICIREKRGFWVRVRERDKGLFYVLIVIEVRLKLETNKE